VALIGEKYGFNIGTLANTVWVIASRVEDNVSLLDMISNALDQTLQNTGDLYILHDDFGKLNLSFLGDMYVPIMIDAETGQNYDYESSIDENTYNRIKLVYDNEDAGKREVYIAQDSSNINRWGILQYFDALQKGENGQAKADALLQLYNKETRTLTIKDAAGDSRVRGGSLVVVQLDLGDVKIQNLMLVEKCVHKYGESKHTMDLTVSGGDFSA
jgi:phage late control gene D protein (GPD)